MDALLLAARLILAVVFVVSGVAKLLDLSGAQAAMRSFGVPESMTRAAGIALPIAEIVIALLLIPAASAIWGGLLAFLLLLAFVAAIGYNLSKGRKFECHCFGQLSRSEIGPQTLIRNAVLAVIAGFVVVAGIARGNAGPGVTEVASSLDAFQWVMLIFAVAILVALGAISWLLVHLLGQNGRLLVRLDRIETALEDADIELSDEDDEDEDEEEEEEGLPFGAPAPAFTLSGLHGETMTLDALRAPGKPVLLIFSDPGCGPCNSLMPDVGKWQHDLADRLTTVVVSRGSLEENRAKQRQHNLTHVLMQKDSEVADAYVTFGTPTAVLVRPDGTIGSGAAGGTEEIRALVKQIIADKVPVPAPRPVAPRPVQPPKPAAAQRPRGLAAIGKDAPVVELNNLDGEPVKLTDFAGHPTAVLFWNPGCGFCQRMVDDLKAWEANPPEGAPKLLVVSTGDAESNREMGLASPMVLDSGFNVGRAFGASGTPSAVLVDAEGKIASGLAVGGPTVISLLRNEAPNLLDASAAADEPEAPAGPRGVAVGGKAPKVQLPDLEGKQIDLDAIRNGRTALIFWNPGCGFCQRMLDDIKTWEKERGPNAPKLVLISTGTTDANKAHGLESTILLDQGFSTGQAFGASGTPSAIVIDAEGNVASNLAVGAPGVMELLRS
ncbi:MAG: TlpA family protein disulfide reductase [Thermomicrobiales bacterium]|nr:TlpA family protein disulfide reductase [Thermomicrobiales bacterium]